MTIKASLCKCDVYNIKKKKKITNNPDTHNMKENKLYG